MTLQEIQALKAANLYNDYLTTTDALVRQQLISAAQNASVLTATGDGNNRVSTMMAYSTGGLNQKYTILFDNSASSEINTCIIGDYQGKVSEEFAAPKGVYVRGNTPNAGKRGIRTGPYLAYYLANGGTISEMRFTSNVGYSQVMVPMQLITNQLVLVAPDPDTMYAVAEMSTNSNILPKNCKLTKQGGVFVVNFSKQAFIFEIQPGDIISVDVSVTGVVDSTAVSGWNA